MKQFFQRLWVIVLVSWVIVEQTNAQEVSFYNEPLLNVIKNVEDLSEYRFLYREAQIVDITISFSGSIHTLFDEIDEQLNKKNLGIKIDHSFLQAMIFNKPKSELSADIQFNGYVIDATTGERLPFSTISWRNNGQFNGISSSLDGAFSIQFITEQSSISFLVSYIGYESKSVELDFEESSEWSDIAVRLTRKPYSGKEIVVQGVNFYSPNDTVLFGFLKQGTFSPLGESNAVRSLQMLPSVSMNSAINDGINIRGSSSDGFEVKLDGQTLYTHNHLFGLLDIMNADVLKSSGFFYDITPAQYSAPLGGTLSLITRNGSLNHFNGTTGLSNTSISTTLEGPIIKGKASWLLSGRHSYLNELDWYNNAQIIEYGLDVNRPSEINDPRISSNLEDNFTLNEIDIQNTNASFYDLHSKIYLENNNGSLLTISGYLGNDLASQVYNRNETDLVTLNETINEWDKSVGSIKYFSRISTTLISETRLGYSDFFSSYRKDDFEYQRRNRGSVIEPLTLSNSIKQFDANQSFAKEFINGSLNFGISYSDFNTEYVELSLARTSFRSIKTSQLVDVFTQYDAIPWSGVTLNIGIRSHYFSNGRYLKFSPRTKVHLNATDKITVSAGFSRNHQFINRLQFYNINSNDFWILSNEDQPPSSSNYFTLGSYFNVSPSLYFQFESYYKDFDNLRLHQLNTFLVSSTFRENDVPFYYDNDGRSKGIEFLMKNRFDKVTLTSAYTLSSMEIKNPQILNGDWFYAAWDQTHQFTITSEISIQRNLNILVGWTYGSGVPNYFEDDFDQPLDSRLPFYSRVDVSVRYEKNFDRSILEAFFSIYNLTDRNNPWYNEIKQVTIRTPRNGNLTGRALTDVFDLGFQPSFNIRVGF